MGKVRYGLCNVHYALHATEGDETFDAPKPLKGAVSLTLTAEGGSSTFHADNTAYATFETNSGYTGELEIAALEDEAAADLLGEVKDAVGGMYEAADAQPAPFALLFELGGNPVQQRLALYNCKVSRPGKEASTTTEETTPDTVKLSFTAIPMDMKVGEEDRKITKYTLEKSAESSAVYDAFFTSVKTPAAVAA